MEQTAPSPILENFLQADSLQKMSANKENKNLLIEFYRELLADLGKKQIALIEESLNKSGIKKTFVSPFKRVMIFRDNTGLFLCSLERSMISRPFFQIDATLSSATSILHR
jgi:hypothetical protein